jgi:omega-amidase
MKVTTVASDIIWRDKTANVAIAEQHADETMKLFPQTDIILFPEMSLTGSVTDEDVVDLAEDENGWCVTEMKRIAQTYQVAIMFGMVGKSEHDKPHNTQVAVSKEGTLLATYHKNHLYEGSKEPELYSPGTRLVTFEIAGWKCGMSACFDIRFPRLFEYYRHAGVECMFSGFNWYAGRNKPDIMETLVKARAHENQFFFVAVDRMGEDPNGGFHGISFIANPFAELLGESEGVYTHAELKKDDMHALRQMLPLDRSFKKEYLF